MKKESTDVNQDATVRDAAEEAKAHGRRKTRRALPPREQAAQRGLANHQLLCIEDPMEVGRSLGVSFQGMERLVFEWRRACYILCERDDRGAITDLFSDRWPEPPKSMAKLTDKEIKFPRLATPKKHVHTLSVNKKSVDILLGNQGARIKEMCAIPGIQSCHVVKDKMEVVVKGKTAKVVEECVQQILVMTGASGATSLTAAVSSTSSTTGKPQTLYENLYSNRAETQTLYEASWQSRGGPYSISRNFAGGGGGTGSDMRKQRAWTMSSNDNGFEQSGGGDERGRRVAHLQKQGGHWQSNSTGGSATDGAQRARGAAASTRGRWAPKLKDGSDQGKRGVQGEAAGHQGFYDQCQASGEWQGDDHRHDRGAGAQRGGKGAGKGGAPARLWRPKPKPVAKVW